MLTKIDFKPGINKDETALASEGGWIDSNRIRFWRGKPQTIGGWVFFAKSPGIARGVHDWADLKGRPLLAWGTASKLFALRGGALLDITPPLSEGVLTAPFSTTNGSAVVTVRHPKHGLSSSELVTFTNAPQTAGLALNATFAISVIDADSYTITAGQNANATVVSGSTATVDYRSALPEGSVDGTPAGYGVGPYGSGPYGIDGRVNRDARVWSLDNFGQNLLASPSGYGLFEWQPVFQPAEVIRNGSFSADSDWVKGTGWTIAGGVATKTAGTASDIRQSVGAGLEAGRVYRATFNVVVSAGSVKLRVNAGSPAAISDIGPASTAITQSGSYSRTFRAPIVPSDILFAADAAFAGTIDSVSIKLETMAVRIETAPARIGAMFVDSNRFVVALATEEADGDYSPLLARWCDQENAQAWFPDSTNLAGELPLSSGSRVITGIASRQQNLLFTDTSLFSLTFTGSADVFSVRLLGTGCGIIGPHAAAEFNGVVFWMARNGFYVFQGSTPLKLDCSVERDVLDHLAPLQDEKVFAGINARYSEVWWMYADARDGKECSRIVVYNFAEQHWATHLLDRTSFVPSGIFGNPLGFAADGTIYEHEVGQTANGAALGWSLLSSAFDVEDGENLVIVKQIVPDFEEQAGAVTFDLTPRLYPNAPNLPTTTHTAATSTDALRMRRKGRQITLGLRSADAPSFARLGALRLDIEKGGAHR